MSSMYTIDYVKIFDKGTENAVNYTMTLFAEYFLDVVRVAMGSV